jgi:hypothetical protein
MSETPPQRPLAYSKYGSRSSTQVRLENVRVARGFPVRPSKVSTFATGAQVNTRTEQFVRHLKRYTNIWFKVCIDAGNMHARSFPVFKMRSSDSRYLPWTESVGQRKRVAIHRCVDVESTL